MSSTRLQESPGRVVVVDDDEVMLLSCREVLGRAGYDVETYDSGEAGLRRVLEVRPPVLIVDLKMPGLDGFEVIRRVRSEAPEVVIVVITGYATVATAVDAMKLGAYDFLPKPFTPEELRLIVRRGFERWLLARESERLRREKEAAERRFLAFVSHQLKTPLVAVKQYLDVLAHTSRDTLPAQAMQWIERSQARLNEMLDLIHDWLALARIERGELCSREARSDLVAIVRRVTERFSNLATQADIRIETALPDEELHVRGDEASVGVLVENLVANAVKYNVAGGRVEVLARDEGGHVILEVRDTGVGIPAEAIPRLGEEFFRVRDDRTRDIPGSGLGLAICRRILGEVGGSWTVESTPGSGSVFRVTLPRAACDGSERSARKHADGEVS